MTTTVVLAPTPVFKAFDNNGLPLINGQLYSYIAGTTTPQATYVDSTGTTPNTNPVILNARGEANGVWLATGLTYKLVLLDAAGNTIWTVDQIPGGQIFTQQSLGLIFYPTLAGEVGVFNNWYNYGNVLRFYGGGDYTNALNNAVASSVVSGTVQIPAGTYSVSGTVTANRPCWIYGTGYDTVIQPASATGDVFQITSLGVDITDMAFSPSVTRTGGYFINVIGSILNYIRLERLLMSNPFYGIGITGGGQSSQLRLSNILIQWASGLSSIASSIGIVITTSVNDANVYCENIFLLGPVSGPQPIAGMQITNVGDITLNTLSTVACGVGLNVVPSTGQSVQTLFATNCFFDSGTGYGALFNPSGSGIINLVKVTDTWASSNVHGFGLAPGGTGTLQLAELTNCTGSNNGSPGGRGNPGAGSGYGVIVGATCLKHTVSGGDFGNNAVGIYESSGVTNFRIIGTICGPSGQFTGNTNVGIDLIGANDKFYIAGNDLQGNTIGGMSIGSLPGTVPQTYVIKDNLGWITETVGTQTLNSGATTTNVTHGLAYAPLVPQITLTPASGIGTAAWAWVSAVTGSNFTISTNANPGAGVSISWTARALH